MVTMRSGKKLVILLANQKKNGYYYKCVSTRCERVLIKNYSQGGYLLC